MKKENKAKDLIKLVHSIDPEAMEDGYIDIAVVIPYKEFFETLGVKTIENPPTIDGYYQNELGVYYCTEDGLCWFWAISGRKTTSRSDTFGHFYLTDSETGSRLPHTKVLCEFRKLLQPKIDKAFNKFMKAEGYR